jgi:hypothetical protein
MRLLLDTHIVLALISDRFAFLPAPVRKRLTDPAGEFSCSVASVWEIAIKWRLGKLPLACDLAELPGMVRAAGVAMLGITDQHAVESALPDPVTRDPFDRMLLAQCKVEGLRLLTMDHALVSHPMAAR